MYNRVQSGSPTKVVNIRLPDLTELNTVSKHVTVVTREVDHTVITLYRYVRMAFHWNAPVMNGLYAREGHIVCSPKRANETLLKLWTLYPDLEPAHVA